MLGLLRETRGEHFGHALREVMNLVVGVAARDGHQHVEPPFARSLGHTHQLELGEQPVAPPGDEEVACILARVLREAKKDWAELSAASPEDEYEVLQQCAMQERLGLAEVLPLHHRALRLAVQDGFSLHADTAVHGHDRQGLERLCRYGARGPVAE